MKINQFIQKYSGQMPKADKQADVAVSYQKSPEISGQHADALKTLFAKYDRTPDTKSIEIINQFMEEAEGSTASKLETVEMALMKELELTPDTLNSIHTALSMGPETLDLLLDVQGTPQDQTEFSIKDVIKIVRNLKIPQAVKEKILDALAQGKDLKKILTDAIKMIAEEIAPGKPFVPQATLPVEDLIKQLIALVHDGKNQLVVKAEDPVDSIEFLPLEEGHQAQTTEKPQEIQDLQDPQEPQETREIQEKISHKTVNESGQEALDLLIQQAVDRISQTVDQEIFQVKQFLVEETTEATLKAKDTFVDFQKALKTVLEFPEKPVLADTQEQILKAIDKLDRLVMRSTVTLFTDMHMEKKLLVASANLQDARNLIANGQLNEAVKVATEVKQTIEKMTFNPSIKRIEGFVSNQNAIIDRLIKQVDGPGTIRVETEVDQALQVFKDASGTRHARDVLDLLRFMGVNHEAEVAEKIEQKDFHKNMEWSQNNVKEILLKLMKEETEQRSVQKSMMNLTGQQMMNQPDDERKRQFHFFNMPFEDGEDVGNMKIYVNGRKEGVKLDADNTELYFGMDSKKLGKLGIKARVHSGKVFLKIMTDSPEKVGPIFETLFDSMEEIGYDKGALEWSAYNSDESRSMVETPRPLGNSNRDYEPEKGFDFKI